MPWAGGKASIVVDTVPESQEFTIPRGPATIRGGDRGFLVAEHTDLRKASKFLHQK